jgi:hypothetical protein
LRPGLPKCSVTQTKANRAVSNCFDLAVPRILAMSRQLFRKTKTQNQCVYPNLLALVATLSPAPQRNLFTLKPYPNGDRKKKSVRIRSHTNCHVDLLLVHILGLLICRKTIFCKMMCNKVTGHIIPSIGPCSKQARCFLYTGRRSLKAVQGGANGPRAPTQHADYPREV